MAEYEWKDAVLSQWEKDLDNDESDWNLRFTKVDGCVTEVFLIHFLHIVAMLLTVEIFGFSTVHFMRFFLYLFCIITSTHTFGCIVNSTSMESVPFETGIKAILNSQRNRTN